MRQHTPKASIDFSHRLNGYEPEKPNLICLCDAIDAMTDRATATTQLLKALFDGLYQGAPLNEHNFYHALNSITLELADIQKTVNAYASANKPKKQA